MKLRHRGVNQFGKVSIAELHGSCMGPGVEEDMFILREQLINIDGHTVEIAERGHRPHFAVWKKVRKFVFRRKPHVSDVQRLFESLEVYPPGGGDDHHHKPLVGFDDHHFGEHVARNMECFSCPSCAVGRVMVDHLIGDLVAVEIGLESLQNGHNDLRGVRGETLKLALKVRSEQGECHHPRARWST